MKREGISTLFIHGFPWALSYSFRSLAFVLTVCLCCGLWKCFEKPLCNGSRFYKNAYKVLFRKMVQRCVCGLCLESVLKRCFAMVLVSIRMYTKCWLLKLFHERCLFLERCFVSVSVELVLFVSKRATRCESTYSKGLKVLFFLLLMLLSYYWFGKKPHRRM